MTTEASQVLGTRVCIRMSLQNIPGEILRRPLTLGNIYCESQLKRKFKTAGDGHSFDDLHIPPGVESEEDVKRWFIYDFGVQGKVDSSDYDKIVHEAYRACRLEDGSL